MASIILRVIAIVASVVAIYGWVATRGKIDSLEQEIAKAETNLNTSDTQTVELELEVHMLNNKVASVRSELADAETRTQKLKTQASQRTIEIKNLKETILLAQTDNEKLDEQNKRLRQEIGNTLNFTSDASAEELETLRLTINSLEAKVEILQQKNRETEDQMRDALAKAENTANSQTRGSNVFSGSNIFGLTSTLGITAPVADGQTASILRIDHDNGLVILNLGSDSGYSKDMEMSILKGFEKAVRIRIQSANDGFSIANVLPGSSASVLAAGDTVEITQ